MVVVLGFFKKNYYAFIAKQMQQNMIFNGISFNSLKFLHGSRFN
jgi:hypothetical protein